MRAQIDFGHVLRELSVNRHDPCEVLRELISNAYDANAKEIHYYPLFEHQGFIFFDNGIGLNDKEQTRGITPYTAFFSIGKSTKTPGDSIGYKCQGSKLCFASSRVHIITKCENESNYRTITIDNPQQNLTLDYDLSPEYTDTPWLSLRKALTTSDTRTEAILSTFNEDFFSNKFKTGTMILIKELKLEDFVKYYDPNTNPKENSYLYNYIRFYTRHGDVRFIEKRQGFSEDSILSVKGEIRDGVRLKIWVHSQLQDIPYGFPYLDEPESSDFKSPLEISRLRDGRFWARHAHKPIPVLEPKGEEVRE